MYCIKGKGCNCETSKTFKTRARTLKMALFRNQLFGIHGLGLQIRASRNTVGFFFFVNCRQNMSFSIFFFLTQNEPYGLNVFQKLL